MRDKYGRKRGERKKIVEEKDTCIWLVIHGDRKKGYRYPYCASAHDYVVNLDVKCGVDCKNYRDGRLL